LTKNQGTMGVFCGPDVPHRGKESRPRSGGLTLIISIKSSERTDDFAILGLGKRLQSLCGDISERSSREGKLRTRFITRELGDQNGIVLPHGQKPRVNLSAFGFSGFLGRIEPGRAVFNFRNSLVRVMDEGHIVWHCGFLHAPMRGGAVREDATAQAAEDLSFLAERQEENTGK
jgi:hypothetical protein